MSIANDQHFSIELIKDEKFKKQFIISTDTEIITRAVDEDIARQAKTYPLAGFSKKGSKPLSIVKRQIGKQVLSEHIDKLVQSAMMKIISDYGLHMSGVPSIDIQELNPEGKTKILVELNVMGEIPVIDWTSDALQIDHLVLQISDVDISQAKDALIKMITEYKTAPDNYKTVVGDAIIIDFHGTLDGQEFEGNQAKQIRIDIGDGSFIPSFENQLIGLSKNDNKTLLVQFPDDYHDKTLASKEVNFEVQVHDVLIKDTTTDSHSELLRRFGVVSDEELHTLLQNKINVDFAQINRVRNKKQLFDKLDNFMDFEVPEEMVKMDFENMFKEVTAKIADGSLKKSEDEAKEELYKIALRRVKLGLILADYARKNHISLSDSDIQKAKDVEKSRKPDNAEAIEKFFSDNANRDVIQGALLEEKVVDHMLEKVHKNDISVTTTEFNEKYAQEIQDLVN